MVNRAEGQKYSNRVGMDWLIIGLILHFSTAYQANVGGGGGKKGTELKKDGNKMKRMRLQQRRGKLGAYQGLERKDRLGWGRDSSAWDGECVCVCVWVCARACAHACMCVCFLLVYNTFIKFNIRR